MDSTGKHMAQFYDNAKMKELNKPASATETKAAALTIVEIAERQDCTTEETYQVLVILGLVPPRT